MKKSTFYILAGVFFVLLQIVAIARNLYFDFVYFFWFCDFVPAVLAIAFFMGRIDFVKGVVNIGLFPQLIYVFSFFAKVFFGVSFLADIEEAFSYNMFVVFSSLLLHLASIVAFGFTYKVRPTRRSFAWSGLGLILIYLVVGVFTVPSESINYVFLFSNFFGVDVLSVLWVPATFLIVVLPTYWFQVLVYRKFGRK